MHAHPDPTIAISDMTLFDGLTASPGDDAIAAAFDHFDDSLTAAGSSWDDVRTFVIRLGDDMPGIASWHAASLR